MRCECVRDGTGAIVDTCAEHRALEESELYHQAAAVKANEQNTALVSALLDLGRHVDGGWCWCGVAMGNPMVREHSAACLRASEAINASKSLREP